MPVRTSPLTHPTVLSAGQRGDAAWLGRLFQHSVRCSLVSSLTLSACVDAYSPAADPAPVPGSIAGAPTEVERSGTAGSAAMGGMGGGAAGSGADPVLELPPCAGELRSLASALTPGREVDYLADRDFDLRTLSSVGEACSGAQDRAECERGLRVPFTGGRHLVTTEGDAVRLWDRDAAADLLYPIESAAEALWLLLAHDYRVPCSTTITWVDGTFKVDPSERSGCDDNGVGSARVITVVQVDAAGTIVELSRRAVEDSGGCPVPGRRPDGLCSRQRLGALGTAQTGVQPASALGEHFASMAHLEAASVPAFAAIAAELTLHAAPRALAMGAWRALADEHRHARLTAGLARRFGAQASAPTTQITPARSLEAFARDNAVEGCVHETYAALLATHQASHAHDRTVRRVMQGIARDETRHAALSWQIAAWAESRLRPAARRRTAEARQAAVQQLASGLDADLPPELCARAGLPDREAAAALHAQLRRALWQSS